MFALGNTTSEPLDQGKLCRISPFNRMLGLQNCMHARSLVAQYWSANPGVGKSMHAQSNCLASEAYQGDTPHTNNKETNPPRTSSRNYAK